MASELQVGRPAPQTTVPGDDDLATIPAYVGPSCFTPRATIAKDQSGRDRCKASLSGAGAVIQRSISSAVRKITGIAFGCSAPTSALGSVVRKANRSAVTSPSRTFRTEVQRVQIPAKQAMGRVVSNANHAGGLDPFGCGSGSEKLMNGTTQRFSEPSHRRQCGDFTLRMFVTPGSVLLPTRADRDEGMPHLANVSSRPSPELRTIGAG